MGLYEDLYKEHEKQDNLEINSPEDVKSLIFSELMRVRIVKNMLKEIHPFGEAVKTNELDEIVEIIERWEGKLSKEVESNE